MTGRPLTLISAELFVSGDYSSTTVLDEQVSRALKRAATSKIPVKTPEDVLEASERQQRQAGARAVRQECLARHPGARRCGRNPEDVGEVVLFHVQDDLLKDGRVDARALDPVARLGGAEYAKLGDLFRLDRARVTKETN